MKRTSVVIGLLAAVAIALLVVPKTRHDKSSAAPSPAHLAAVRKAPHAPKRYLYTLDGHSGTLVPAQAKGEYRLTVSGVHPTALYYLDRPGAEVGTITIRELLAGLFGKPGEASPNAAVNAVVPAAGGHQLTMGVTLLSATYDKSHQSVRFLVRALPQGPSSRREHGRTDVVLPPAFSHTALFIDDGGNTCNGTVTNYTLNSLPLSASGDWSTDDWSPKPQSVGVFPADTMGYESDGGYDRGCHNWVTFAMPDGGTIQLSLTDPYKGSNTVDCDNATYGQSEFKCGYFGSSLVGTDNMSIDWVICSNNPQYESNIPTANGAWGGCDYLDPTLGDAVGGDGGVTWVG